jgi:hypothetical protein
MRYATPQFGETMHAVGKFLSALPAGQIQAVLVRNLTTGASLSIASANATEIPGTAFGGFATYEWSTANLTTPLTVFAELIVILRDTVTGRIQESKVVVGGYPDESALQRFGGRVHVDTVLGVPGTAYPRGTPELPVNNLANAFTIRAAFNLPKAFLIRSNGSTLLLDATVNGGVFTDFTFEGVDPQNDIIRFSTGAGAISTAGVRLGRITAWGNFSGRVIGTECQIGLSTGNTTGLDGTFDNCTFEADGASGFSIALSIGSAFNLVGPARAGDVGLVGFGGGTRIDMGAGAATMLAEGLVGFWQFVNIAGGDLLAAVLKGAQVHFSTGSGSPIIVLAGIGEIVNTVGFPLASERVVRGSDTIATRKHLTNNRMVDWVPNPAQEVVYNDDEVTELQRADLFDQFGANINTGNRPQGPLISKRDVV